MRRLAIGIFAVAIVAAPAMGDLSGGPRTGQVLTATHDYSGDQGGLRAETAVYDSWGYDLSIPGPAPGAAGFFAAPPATGQIGLDDYDTVSGVNLTKARFVGGVTAVSDITFRPNVVWFEYYTTGFAFATSFGVSFPQAGNFFWTITFSSPPFIIPHTGYMRIVSNTTWAPTTWSTSIAGQWFLTSSDAVLIGTNSTTLGDTGTGIGTSAGVTTVTGRLVHTFRFDIPEPATMGLLGAGMLLVLRRRR